MCRLRRVSQPDDLQVNRAAGQAKDRPVPAVAVSARAPASSEAGPEGSGSNHPRHFPDDIFIGYTSEKSP
jgi:hypothetical protein